VAYYLDYTKYKIPTGKISFPSSPFYLFLKINFFENDFSIIEKFTKRILSF